MPGFWACRLARALSTCQGLMRIFLALRKTCSLGLSGLNCLTADRLGRFWTRDKPTGPFQSIIDSALDPTWGNTGTHWLRIDVPAGTTLHEGIAAAQRGLVGGGNQIAIEQIPSGWIKEQVLGDF